MMSRTPPLGRRTLLRGFGAALALPLLEGMTQTAKAADIAQDIKRLLVFYTPNGFIMPEYVPAKAGANWEMTPSLKPLEPYRDKLTLIIGMAHAMGVGGGGHARASATFLTGTGPKKTEGYDIRCGVSIDQIVAKQLGKETMFSSLEMGVEPPSLMGSCDSGHSCAYTNTLCWSTPTTPLPMSVNPRAIFERLFGDGDSLDADSRMADLRNRASILDFVMDDASRMAKRLGANDQRKMDEYLTSVRDVETRIQKAEKGAVITADMERPAGIPDNFQDHVRLLIDLQLLAMQADLTRVGTLMLGRELSNRSYPEIGVSDSHHAMSHHGNDPEKMAKVAKINVYHMEQYAYLLKRMGETRHGERTLLDRTLVLQGSGMGDPNSHDHHNLPLSVAGGLVKGNNYIAAAKETPMCNLLVSMMQMLDVEQTQFGDSTGTFDAMTA
jgi:hypothetical protein